MADQYIEKENQVWRVKGTRVALDSIIYQFQQGRSPEAIQDTFPVLFAQPGLRRDCLLSNKLRGAAPFCRVPLERLVSRCHRPNPLSAPWRQSTTSTTWRHSVLVTEKCYQLIYCRIACLSRTNKPDIRLCLINKANVLGKVILRNWSDPRQCLQNAYALCF